MYTGLTAADRELLLRTFGGAGYVIHDVPPPTAYGLRAQWVLNEWRHGRQVTDEPLPGPIDNSPPFTFADGFMLPVAPRRYTPNGIPRPPKAPSRAEWAALVAEHGLDPAFFVRNRKVDDGSEEGSDEETGEEADADEADEEMPDVW